LETVIAKVELASGFTLSVPEVALAPWPTPACAACGGRLRFYRSLRARSTPQENGLGSPLAKPGAMSA